MIIRSIRGRRFMYNRSQSFKCSPVTFNISRRAITITFRENKSNFDGSVRNLQRSDVVGDLSSGEGLIVANTKDPNIVAELWRKALVEK